MNRRKSSIVAVIVYSGLVACLSPDQDLEVKPAEQPYYTLTGRVIDAESDQRIDSAEVSVSMEILVQGEWTENKVCVSDSNGRYRLDSLYRAQYRIEMKQRGKLCFSKSILMWEYADREYDIVKPGPPEINFSGKMIRCSDGVGCSDVQVYLWPSRIENGGIIEEKTATTNSKGFFQIKGLYQGLYTVSALGINYLPLIEPIYIDDSASALFYHEFCMNQGITP